MENQSWKEKLEQVRAHGKTEQVQEQVKTKEQLESDDCLLYTSPSPRD